MIDRKYKFLAVNPCSGNIHTEDDAVVFLAKDKALPYALEEYYRQCKRLQCDESHLESINLLMSRVDNYQANEGSQIPDTNTPCEIDRCIGGKV